MMFAWWIPVVFVAAAAPSLDVSIPETETTIADGTPTTTCQWPTTAMLGFAGCSATLVSPWIVITAAHCVPDVDNPGEVVLGESLASPQQALPVDYCRRGPEWDPTDNNGVGGSDISYCKLVTPVYDYPVTPIVYGCETEILSVGREVWIVGIGASEPDGSGFGTKRMAPTTIGFVDPEITDNGIGVGDAMHDSCSGDSGGPAYVQYPDGSWHVFGVTSGGPKGCGSAGPSNYTAMHAWVPWIEEDSGIDVTPCHDVDGTWNPTGWCQGFEMDPFDDGEWSQMCLGEVSAPSATCGAAFDAEPDVDPPTITVTGPADETIFDTGPANVTLTFDADDGEGWGVRVVRVSINGAVQDVELREPPYTLPAQFPQGGYEIVGIAEDFAGNLGESALVRIAVDDELPPLPEGTSTGVVDDTGDVDGTTSQGPEAPGSSSGELGTSTGAPAADGDGTGGCGCASDRTPRVAPWMLGAIAVLWRRRGTRSTHPRRGQGAELPAGPLP
jgi:MYXO-CTERM domain-containing protein